MSFSRMFQHIQQRLAGPSEDPQSKDEAIRLATAGLFLEIAHADAKMNAEEEHKLAEHLCELFDVDQEMARELMEAADEMRLEAIDHFQFTRTIRENTTLADRIDVVKRMWRIVYLDGILHEYEEYLVRKLAELLGLQHHVMIETKLAVQKELGQGA
jgi:uncharacterized tellurite resistance protein B-like protein